MKKSFKYIQDFAPNLFQKIPSPHNDAIHRICIENICLKTRRVLFLRREKIFFFLEKFRRFLRTVFLFLTAKGKKTGYFAYINSIIEGLSGTGPRDTRERWSPADCWNCSEWGLLVYIRKGSLWLVRWARRAGSIEFCPALAACSSQPSTKYFFSSPHTFHFISPHLRATWAGSRAGSPVFVSLTGPMDLRINFSANFS